MSSKRSHRQNFRVAAIALLALFIAQFGALAHAYSHYSATAKLVAPAQSPSNQQTSNGQEYCGECLNFAPLLAAAAAPALPPLALQRSPSPVPLAQPPSLLEHRTYLAFRSRAPPVTR